MKIKVRDKSISKYFYRMRKKALFVGYSLGRTKRGNQLFPWNLYKVYSTSNKRNLNYKEAQNFITYLKRVDEHNLIRGDNKAEKLLVKNKSYIRKFIKQGRNEKIKRLEECLCLIRYNNCLKECNKK